ncbi:MAG: hypothetical protein CRN43_01445 [Candidatus Nephrothrix sp. EaCA]|nr:MAG: hypothetical protein CRN43_01445 [Candidatus Nephrothrix sp. EaCA]
MKTKIKQFCLLWAVIFILIADLSCKDRGKGKDTKDKEKPPSSPSYACFRARQKKAKKIRILDTLKNVEAYVVLMDSKTCPQSPHAGEIWWLDYPNIRKEFIDTSKDISLGPQYAYRCGGDPYLEDAPRKVLLNGLFYIEAINDSCYHYFYDEGEGNPAYTKVE